MKLADLFTRQTANETRNMPLELPDGSVSSEFHLEVVSTESDLFRRAETKAKRRAVEAAAIKDEDASLDFQTEVEIEMLASMVVGWNLEDEFSHEGVKDLLRESTGNKERLSRFAATRSHWFEKKQKSSSTGSKQK